MQVDDNIREEKEDWRAGRCGAAIESMERFEIQKKAAVERAERRGTGRKIPLFLDEVQREARSCRHRVNCAESAARSFHLVLQIGLAQRC